MIAIRNAYYTTFGAPKSYDSIYDTSLDSSNKIDVWYGRGA